MIYREIWKTPIGEVISPKVVYDEMVNILNQTTLDCLSDDSNIFTKWVKHSCKEYLQNFYSNYKDIIITHGYLSIQTYGQSFKVHAHPTADIAAVYYVETNSEHPNIELIDPRPAHKFNGVTNDNYGKTCDDVRVFEINPESGKLIFFPGYLLHSVGSNLTNHARYAFSMNINLV